MDLTPRSPGDAGNPEGTRSRRSASRRRWVPLVVVALAIVAGGVVVTQFLTSAIDYYCNVDEVGAREGCEGDRRMRVQGVVDEGSVAKSDGGTTFSLSFHGQSLKVRYLGDPGGVFQECIPVVAHGRLSGGVFESDRIEVKHTNQYVEKNEGRLQEADQEAAACSVLKD